MAAFNPATVKVAQKLVYPTLQLKPAVPVYVRILKGMETSKSKVVKKGQENRAPATVMLVNDLADDDKEKQIVCNKVLVGILEEAGEYVGKCFRITKGGEKQKGDAGEYYKFEVDVIEDPKKAK